MKSDKKEIEKLTKNGLVLLLAGTMIMTFVGCSNSYSDQDDLNKQESTIEQESTIKFGIGEHIISVPIENDIRHGNVQYEYHEGYEPIGISVTAYGQSVDIYGGGVIIYSNVEEVECSSNQINNDKYLYLDFGTPLYHDKNTYKSNDDVKEFDIGEHIISVPIESDIRFNNSQYEYHEGYEVIGIATSAKGKSVNSFGGGVLLYKNTIPVRCTREDNGYTSFGIPYEKDQVKTLK